MIYQDFDLWRRSEASIAQGALTNSKHPDRHVKGVYPTHVIKAYQATLICNDGRAYKDYICGLGTNLFGYGNNLINEYVFDALRNGSCHSLPTRWEVEVAELLKQQFFFTERWKFFKGGSEACSAAVKIARAYTGRIKVLSDGYHGWHDSFVSLTPPAYGVAPCPVEKLELEKIDKDTACVIVEPVVLDASEARVKYLQDLKSRCEKVGALLIFDEVICGFRFPKACVAQYFNIIPDLIVLGKAMGNGWPIAAVAGKKHIMEGEYFISLTNAGEIGSLMAVKRVLHLLNSVHEYKFYRLWEAGERFIKRFNQTTQGYVSLVGYPTRGALMGEKDNLHAFFQEAAKAGYLFGPSWFYNYDLMKSDESFFQFLKNFMQKINVGPIQLEGQAPTPAFSKKVRDE